MKRIVIRDLRAYRTFWMLEVIVTLLYTYLNIRFGSIDGIVGFLLVFLPPIAVMVLFLGDADLIGQMAALPITRAEMVLGKYLSTYLICFSIIGGTIVMMGMLGIWYELAMDDFWTLLSVKGLIFALLPMTIIMSISYPFLFRYGFRIGTMLISGSVFLSYAIVTILSERYLKKYLVLDRRGVFAMMMEVFRIGQDRFGALSFYLGLIVIMTTMLLGSIKLSLHWMRAKDL